MHLHVAQAAISGSSINLIVKMTSDLDRKVNRVKELLTVLNENQEHIGIPDGNFSEVSSLLSEIGSIVPVEPL